MGSYPSFFLPEEPVEGKFTFKTIQIIADSDLDWEFAPRDPKFVGWLDNSIFYL